MNIDFVSKITLHNQISNYQYITTGFQYSLLKLLNISIGISRSMIKKQSDWDYAFNFNWLIFSVSFYKNCEIPHRRLHGGCNLVHFPTSKMCIAVLKLRLWNQASFADAIWINKIGACRERCSPITHHFCLYISHQRKMLDFRAVLSKLLYTFYSSGNGFNHNLRVVFYVEFRNFCKN